MRTPRAAVPPLTRVAYAAAVVAAAVVVRTRHLRKRPIPPIVGATGRAVADSVVSILS